jgi:hypothetical protein
MRRSIALVSAALLCLVVITPAAAKGKPAISWLDPTGITSADLAGTCDFPVEVVDSFSNSKEMVFPVDRAGNQLIRTTGGYKSTITRTDLDPDVSMEISYMGTVNLLFRPDGTVDVKTTGTVLNWIYEGDDLSVLEPGIYLITGTVRTTLDAATFTVLVPEVIKGKVVDLCEALSD